MTRKVLASAGGLGYLPIAPGTWGSLAGVAIFLLAGLSGSLWFSATITLAALILFAALNIALGPWACSHYGKKDPSQVVIDEVAGYLLAVLLLPVDGMNLFYSAALAFITFRIFDIIKPPPARQLERLPKGWGILADDLAAGLYANLLCQCLMRTVVPVFLGKTLPQIMTVPQAVLLGGLQGLTEFLPVSSSGHLALLQKFMALEPDSSEMMLFDLVIHVATLAAVAVVFARPLVRLLRSLWLAPGKYGLSRQFFTNSCGVRLIGLTILASVPTALVYFLFKDRIETAFNHPLAIAGAMLTTGLLIVLAERLGSPTRSLRNFGIATALIIGLAQGLALLPGLSRSGLTICVALLCGIKRGWAGRFSFLIAAPAILGGFLLQLLDVAADGTMNLSLLLALGAGALTAFCVGLWALRVLLKSLNRGKLSYFAIYLWIFGLTVITWQLLHR